MKAPKVIRQNGNVRVVVRTPAELFKEDQDDKGEYVGGKWGGMYLRAPDIFFRILEKAGDKLVRLGDVAEVRRGFTTGANEFFYLEPIKLSVKEVAELGKQDPMAPVMVRNDAGWEGEIEAAWLQSILKSPREIRTIRVRLEDLRYLVFMSPQDVREVIEVGEDPPLERYPLAAAYIEWGERAVYVCKKRGCRYRGTDPVCPRHGSSNIERDAIPERSTLRSRPRWWDLVVRDAALFVWPMVHNDRLTLAILNTHMFRIFVDHNLFEVAADDKAVVAVTTTTFTLITRELLGRSNLGQGALKTEGIDIVRLLILNPASFRFVGLTPFFSTFDRLSHQPIRSIFEELGFTLCQQRRCSHPEHPHEYVHPEELTLEQVKKASPDRFELDRVVFDVLGLTDEERLEVYRAVVQLVKDRLIKARSNTNGN